MFVSTNVGIINKYCYCNCSCLSCVFFIEPRKIRIPNRFHFSLFCVLDLDAAIANMMFRSATVGGGQWECSVCGKTSKLKSDVSRHIEGRRSMNC